MTIKDLFSTYRNYLFTVAYRMLGVVEEAEDVVQDVYLKIQHLNTDSIRSPKAYLAQVATRLCLDRLEELRKNRENYIGPWLPEPLPTETMSSMSHRESLSTAYLLMLERLKPVERAVFLLREAFGHSYEDIGLVLNKRPENCRKIFSRSKKRLKRGAPLPHQDRGKAEELLRQLIAFAEEGRYEDLTRLFIEDAIVMADGGGKVKGALRQVLHGAEKAGKFILGATRKLRPEGSVYLPAEFNGAPAVVGKINGKVFLILSISHNGEKVTALYALANPDKLRHIRV